MTGNEPLFNNIISDQLFSKPIPCNCLLSGNEALSQSRRICVILGHLVHTIGIKRFQLMATFGWLSDLFPFIGKTAAMDPSCPTLRDSRAANSFVVLAVIPLGSSTAQNHLNPASEINKAGYTATLVACRWAGAVLEKVTRASGQEP